MIPKIKYIQYKNGYIYHVRFQDNREGDIDFMPFLWGEAFEKLKDKQKFQKAFINIITGTITWPDGPDIAPEALHEQLVKVKENKMKTAYSQEEPSLRNLL